MWNLSPNCFHIYRKLALQDITFSFERTQNSELWKHLLQLGTCMWATSSSGSHVLSCIVTLASSLFAFLPLRKLMSEKNPITFWSLKPSLTHSSSPSEALILSSKLPSPVMPILWPMLISFCSTSSNHGPFLSFLPTLTLIFWAPPRISAIFEMTIILCATTIRQFES